MKSSICTSILALLCAATTAQANLIIDPGFENNPLNTFSNVLDFFALNEGDWGAEAATITLATGGVTPPEGTHMLRMTGNPATYQTAQVTNVSSGPYASLISSGNALANLSAYFTTGPSVTGARGGVILSFYSGTDWDTDQISSLSTVLDLVGDTVWEKASVTGAAIPINTAWIVSQVVFSGATLGANPGFVDEASLTIEAVPEPGTALFGIACVGIAAFRRRRNSAV